MTTPKLTKQESVGILERWAWNNGRKKMQSGWTTTYPPSKGEDLGVTLSDAYADGFYDGCTWLLEQMIKKGLVKKDKL